MYDDVVVVVKKAEKNGEAGPQPQTDSVPVRLRSPSNDAVSRDESSGKPPLRRGTVAKVSHTLSVALAERLEEFAFYQRVSESAVIEYSLSAFFAQSMDDAKLGEQLRRGGAGRRRKSG